MLFPFKKKESTALRKKKVSWQLSPLQFQLIVGLVIVVVIALLLTLVWHVTRIESLQIAHTNIVGGETIPHSTIEDTVNASLTGTYLKLVPKRFMPLYPKSTIVENIKRLDRVKNVHVEIADDQTVNVVFDEYVPFALWCETPDSLSCLFIDKIGYAFSLAPELEGSAFVRYVEEDVHPEVGATLFDAAFIDGTELFTELLKDELGLYVTHVVKRNVYDIEYHISGGGLIKASHTIPMEETFSNLQTILSSEAFLHIEPGAFQYIDLRFGDKVFVNEEPQQVSTTTAEGSAQDE